MRSFHEIIYSGRIIMSKAGLDGGMGYAFYPGCGDRMAIVFSWGGGWDHVSVSYKRRCPTWEEMCWVKDLFFLDEECVIQYHPPTQDYVNDHPYALHLWRPQHATIPTPPKHFV